MFDRAEAAQYGRAPNSLLLLPDSGTGIQPAGPVVVGEDVRLELRQ